MKKFLIAILLALNTSIAYAQVPLNLYQPGPRLIDGTQLNKMVVQVNNLTGNGSAGSTVKLTNGTVALPSLSFFSDLDTGIYRIGANNLGIAANGAKVLDIGTSGIAVVGTFTLGSTVFSEATLSLYVKGVAAGYKVARGETALDGTNPTPAATGLASIVSCAVSIKTTSAPALSTSVVTYDTSVGTVNLYGWKPTGAGDTTLIASTGTDTIGWVCVGT